MTNSGNTNTPSRSSCSSVLSEILPVRLPISENVTFFNCVLSLILISFIGITLGRLLISICLGKPIHNAVLIVHSLNIFL